MADTDATITFDLELDDGSIRKVRASVQEIADQLEKALKNGTSSGIDKSFTGIITQLRFIKDVAASVFGFVGSQMRDAFHEAIEAEANLNQLSHALANTGQFSIGAVESIQKFASGLQDVGTVSDDVVLKGAALLVSIGQLSTKQLPAATQAAVNFSAATGTDLAGSFEILSKAASGNVGILSRYGVKISESIPASERFATAIDLINKRFAGADAARAETFGGSLLRIKNNIADLLQVIGEFGTRSPALSKAINFISSTIKSITDAIGKFANNGGQNDIFKPIIISIANVGIEISKLTPIASGFLAVGKTVVNALIEIAAHGAVAISSVGAVAGRVLNAVGVISDDAKEFFVNTEKDAIKFLEGATKNTEESIGKIGDAFNVNSPQVTAFFENLRTQTENTSGKLKPLVEEVANVPQNLNIPTMTQLFQLAGTELDIFGQKLTALPTVEFQKKVDDLNKSFRSLGTEGRNAIGNGLASGFSAFGAALVKGQNAVEAFAKAFIGAIGQAAIASGTRFIIEGLAYATVPGFQATGAAMITAGAALAAFGGALTAFAGQSAGPGGGGAGGGAGGGVSSVDTPALAAPELDRNRKTEVAVNIQGNVLDRRETGLEIASVLQEFFDKQDGVLVRG